MAAVRRFLVPVLVVFVVVLSACAPPRDAPVPGSPRPLSEGPSFGEEAEKVLDFGTRPGGMAAPLSEAMERDQIFRQQLAAEGWVLRAHPFQSGAEMQPYLNRLDAAFLGDLPAMMALASGELDLVALSRRGYNTVISSRRLTPADLRGRKVGYTALTSAHFTVWKAAKSAGLTTRDFVSVPLRSDQTLAALRDASVDAVALWEPQVSAVLAALPQAKAMTRTESFSFVLLDRGLVEHHPKIAEAFLASLLRSVNWLRESPNHLKTSLRWSQQAWRQLTGGSGLDDSAVSVAQLRAETIDNPSFPLLPLDLVDEGSLVRQQFDFLVAEGYLASNQRWADLAAHIDLGLMPRVLSQGDWQLNRFAFEGDTP